ncbi:MAG: septum formation protein Maf [Bdellovibrionaceae bacterium]|nr:septum formation protein Maf [Pseudobdellovibrionaceae bacterium]
MRHLILASESPRRKELLQNAGFRFQVVPVKVSEIPDKNLNVNEQILEIAGRKARAAFEDLRGRFKEPFVVLAADTEVILDDGPLGKPSSPEDAVRTLKNLSGRVHEVITAVWMIDSSSGKAVSHLETTKVFFRTLSETEIRDYVATGEPMDKAGSYGIQGLGGRLVERIEGDFQNVVGLPVGAVKKMIQQNDWSFRA